MVSLIVYLSYFLLKLIRAMRLDEDQAQALLEEYSGPRYEIEKQMMVHDS